ncbi:hypothetical protein [Actinoplanes sp. NPDC051859]|uniref:hypothetical protein n=1 Tax=Actinoplanes sp. NPDC051859 TaxID=3363909 RepID=UPI0037883B0C
MPDTPAEKPMPDTPGKMPDTPENAPPPGTASPGSGNASPGSGNASPGSGNASPGSGNASPGGGTANDKNTSNGGGKVEGNNASIEGGNAAQAPVDSGDQSAGFKLAAFGALVVVVLFAGYGIGRLNNSVDQTRATPPATQQQSASHGTHNAAAAAPAAPHDDSGAAPHQHNADGTVTQVAGSGAATQTVGGLALTASGLTLQPASVQFTAGRAQPFTFKVTGAGGAPITTYAVVHDKPLHLVVVRRDLTGFQHLHPTMAADGTWSIDLTLAAPGSYRAIADFTAVVGGQQTPATLGIDLMVAGDFTPAELPAPVAEASTDGFSVQYRGKPQIGSTQPILMSVRGADGKPAALEPYLGAFGHLVVLREGDVGYVHVHPEAGPVAGGVKFWLAAPGPGRYRMFFDFQVAGKVHTVAFSTVVE